jgi:protein-disulfide isomerase
MRDLRIWVATLALLVATSAVGMTTLVWAQSEPAGKPDESGLAALRSDLERVKSELEGVRNELRQLREVILQWRAQPQPGQPPVRVVAKVALGDNPTLGTKDAPVTLIEFSDYQCPFCRQFFETTLPTLKQEYIEAGKLRYVFRDFPIEQIHPLARTAAEAARCAGDQGKYWEMHDLLFRNQQALQSEQLKAHAGRLQLDEKAFGACLEGGKHRTLVQQNYDEGISAGVRGTPSFLLGKTHSDGTIEGLLITGARPLNEFRQEIERLLTEK